MCGTVSESQKQPELARVRPKCDAVDGRRVRLGVFPTPLQSMTDWGVPSAGGADGEEILMVKRDDLAGFFVAGNKTRPLEFLIGDALATNAKTMIGCGTPGSNFIAALALAARHAGLQCELLIAGESQASISLDIARTVGARIHVTTLPREDLDAAATERAEQLTADGNPAYPVPRGGASSTGCLGFAQAAVEIDEQLAGKPTTIVIPVGSGASVAGLCAGIMAHDLPHRVIGVSVSRPLEQMRERIAELTTDCLRLLEAPTRDVAPMVADHLTLIDRTEPPTAADLLIAHDAMRRYPFTVDLHYGLPAFSEAASWVAAHPGTSVVYWCTGGVLGYPELINAMAAA